MVFILYLLALHTIWANALETFPYLVYAKVLIICGTPKKAVTHWEKFESVEWWSFLFGAKMLLLCRCCRLCCSHKVKSKQWGAWVGGNFSKERERQYLGAGIGWSGWKIRGVESLEWKWKRSTNCNVNYNSPRCRFFPLSFTQAANLRTFTVSTKSVINAKKNIYLNFILVVK